MFKKLVTKKLLSNSVISSRNYSVVQATTKPQPPATEKEKLDKLHSQLLALQKKCGDALAQALIAAILKSTSKLKKR